MNEDSIKPKNLSITEWQSKLENSSLTFNIVIVGAGPVGLLAAINLGKLYGNQVQIWVLEKRKNYTRDQILVLTQATIKMLPKEVFSQLFGPNLPGCFILPPDRDKVGRCYQKEGYFASIRIATLEKGLYEYVLKNPNILVLKPITKIHYGQTHIQIDYEQNKSFSLKCNILIGADGANSQIRKEVLKGSFVLNQFCDDDRRYYGGAFIFKEEQNEEIYEIPRKSHLHQIETKYPQNKSRFFRSQTEKMSYLGLTLTEEEYKFIQQQILTEGIKSKLLRIYRSYTQRKCNLSNLIFYSSFESSPRISSVFSQFLGMPTFLVGDAALTTHFFIGEGLAIGAATISILIELLQSHPTGHIPPLAYKNSLIELAIYIGVQISLTELS